MNLIERMQKIVVCGAHMTGLALNHELVDRGAIWVQSTRTLPEYRLFALAGGPPQRPGLLRVAQQGVAIEVEVWQLPLHAWGDVVTGIPAPLGIGTIRLEQGDWIQGFLCEWIATQDAQDISEYGGWRAWLNAKTNPAATHSVYD